MGSQWLISLCTAMLPSLIVSIIMLRYERRQKKRDDKNDRREQDRIKSERVRIDLLVAAADLSYACAMALKRGKANGEVEDGVMSYNKAMDKFHDFERDQVARKG